MVVGSLQSDAIEDEIRALFELRGKIFHISLAHDIFKGTSKGFGFGKMECHEA